MRPGTDVFQTDRDSKHYTHLNFKDDPEEFHFMVIADNAGGARPGVFARAVEVANLLQPELVVQVGNLIEGYDDDESQIREWWQEIDDILERLSPA